MPLLAWNSIQAQPLRPAAPLAVPAFRTNLHFYNSATNTSVFADGATAKYDNSYCACVDSRDDIKLTNVNETVGLLRSASFLSTERRPLIVSVDTLFIHLDRTTERDYQWALVPQGMYQPGLAAKIVDAYTNTQAIVSLTDTTRYFFTVNADPASQNPDRFMVVFGPSAIVLPLQFTNFSLNANNKGALLAWQMDNEWNATGYDIQRSADGVHFTTIRSLSASNRGSALYQWNDVSVQKGLWYYRVLLQLNNGSEVYSKLQSVNITASSPSVQIYPNPGNGQQIGLQLEQLNKGDYQAKLISINGKHLQTFNIRHNGGSAYQNLVPSRPLSPGEYLLQVTNNHGFVNIRPFVVQR